MEPLTWTWTEPCASEWRLAALEVLGDGAQTRRSTALCKLAALEDLGVWPVSGAKAGRSAADRDLRGGLSGMRAMPILPTNTEFYEIFKKCKLFLLSYYLYNNNSSSLVFPYVYNNIAYRAFFRFFAWYSETNFLFKKKLRFSFSSKWKLSNKAKHYIILPVVVGGRGTHKVDMKGRTRRSHRTRTLGKGTHGAVIETRINLEKILFRI